MIKFSHRVAAVAVLVAGLFAGHAGSAGAVGAGTFTKITTPANGFNFKFDSSRPSGHHLTVAGITSADVTSVDIVCMNNSTTGPSIQTLTDNLAVSGGSFSTTLNLQPAGQCRYRAIPDGVDPFNDYVGSFSGPIVYMTGIQYTTVGSTKIGFVALDEQGDGLVASLDAGQCGPAISTTVAPPGMDIRGSTGAQNCGFALPSANITPSGNPNASSMKVDGHSAYLPIHVDNFLNQPPQSLGLTQPPLTVSLVRKANNDLTVTETAKLWRCSVSDAYPPTSTSCPSLVYTGVTFRRVTNLFRGAHQARVRDTFTATDSHSHALNILYEGGIDTPDTGAVGFAFPGGNGTFHKAALDQVVHGLGTKAGTIYVRSDLFAGPDDPAADTLGVTWSRAPQKVQFAHDTPNLFGMPYTLGVAAHGRADLGFAYTAAVTTAAERRLGAISEHEMVATPSIASPADGAQVNGTSTTVRGAVAIGANGLPVKVTVNGHIAPLTTVSDTKRTYAVTFTEALGKHKITVTAIDSAGNKQSKSIKITNS
jgi:hypothetical protein